MLGANAAGFVKVANAMVAQWRALIVFHNPFQRSVRFVRTDRFHMRLRHNAQRSMTIA